MINQPKEFSVDGKTFMMNKMNAKKSVRVLLKLARLMGKPFSVFVEDKGKGDATSTAKVLEALALLFQTADDDAVIEVIELLFEDVIVQGQGSQQLKTIWPEFFKGNTMAVFKVALEVVNHNYENFFDQVVSLVPGFVAQDKG